MESLKGGSVGTNRVSKIYMKLDKVQRPFRFENFVFVKARDHLIH